MAALSLMVLLQAGLLIVTLTLPKYRETEHPLVSDVVNSLVLLLVVSLSALTLVALSYVVSPTS